MALRWCAAGVVEAGTQFRRVNGHLHLRALRNTLDRVTAPPRRHPSRPRRRGLMISTKTGDLPPIRPRPLAGSRTAWGR
jgi:hypothetical protein